MTDPEPTPSDPAAAPGGDYNLIPYTSMPFPQSHPPRLAALAAMFGLSPPPVPQCRMLELGCASGGNLVPLALRFPRSQYRGVDLTERHVRDGQARVQALGLKNIRIEQGDISALRLDGERFDYIVCHGVYSWVPPPVRDAILRICAESLADNGVAYVSYNVYPGWQLRGVIRDMMVYHAGMEGDPKLRVGKARWVLDNIAKATRAGSPYGEMLRSEAAMLARTDDSYILGEFLERENAPCYFREFAAKAESFGLTYLCESELSQCIPEHISPEVGALIRTMSANKLIPLEQYMDFFKGRAFRQTLLVKAAQAPRIERTLLPHRAKGLHVAGRLTATEQADRTWVFTDTGRGSIGTGTEAVRRALARLSEVYPATRTAEELDAEVRPHLAPEDRALTPEGAILDAVFKMILIGLVEVSSVPLRASRTSGARPKAWPLARLDAEHKLRWTSGPTGRVVALDVVCSALLPRLDGAHDRDALEKALLREVRDGRIRFTDDKSGLELAGPALEEAARRHVTTALERLGSAGILE